jgi:fructosamine-3-kinase
MRDSRCGVPEFLNQVIADLMGADVKVTASEPVSGGCIHQVFKIDLSNQKSLLLKISKRPQIGFQTEVEGLAEIGKTQTFRVPKVLASDELPLPYLLMEWIDTAPADEGFWTRFGQQLADLHLDQSSRQQLRFGFGANNWIGATPQVNTFADSWGAFFCQHRLEYQFRLACQKGIFSNNHQKRFRRFAQRVAEMLDSITVFPSLIHGDLWSGNFLCDIDRQPVLIDPAVSYSHREAEFSIMQMFGGFAPGFYAAYHQVLPPCDGSVERIEIYSLYHYLNHLNLFGRSYFDDCVSIIEKYS